MMKIIESKKVYNDLKVLLTIGSYDTKAYGFDAVANPSDTNVNLNLRIKILKT